MSIVSLLIAEFHGKPFFEGETAARAKATPANSYAEVLAAFLAGGALAKMSDVSGASSSITDKSPSRRAGR